MIQDKPFLFFGIREGGNEGMGCDGQRQEEWAMVLKPKSPLSAGPPTLESELKL